MLEIKQLLLLINEWQGGVAMKKGMLTVNPVFMRRILMSLQVREEELIQSDRDFINVDITTEI